MRTWLLVLVALSGCIDFDDARRVFCVNHPGLADCLEDGGTGDGGMDACMMPGIEGDGGANVAAETRPQIGAYALPCPIPSPPGAQIYVAHDVGSDTLNDGGWQSPLATIGAGLAAASKLGQSEVRVCAGVYTERVVMTDPSVSLLGGFDCLTGQRWPGCFDPRESTSFTAGSGVFTTSIVDPGTASSGVVTTVLLAFDGGGFPTLEMFTISGSDAGTETRAVEVAGDDRARPSITNNRIFGGLADCTAPVQHCNTALRVSSGGPRVQDNLIIGGAGTLPAGRCASCGVVLTGPTAAPQLISNVILGGAGGMNDGGSPSIGLVFDGVGQPVVLQNDINGGAGSCLMSGCAGDVAVYFSANQSTDVEVVANQIRGTHPMVPVLARALGVLVEAKPPATITLARNKIFSGNTVGSEALSGIDLETSGADVEVINNMIYAGDPVHPHNGPVAGIVYGPRQAGGYVTVAHNAIVSVAGPNGQSEALLINANNDRGVATLQVANNLLVSNGEAGSTGIDFEVCPNTQLDLLLYNNVFAGASACGRYTGANTGCWQTAPLMVHADALEASVNSLSLSSATSNLEYAARCSDENTCVCRPGCASAASCAAEIFGPWDAGTFGFDELFSRGQWNLDPNPAGGPPPCGLINGQDDTASVTVDIYGNTRTAPPTIGPVELDTNTCSVTGP